MALACCGVRVKSKSASESASLAGLHTSSDERQQAWAQLPEEEQKQP